MKLSEGINIYNKSSLYIKKEKSVLRGSRREKLRDQETANMDADQRLKDGSDLSTKTKT